ncbi:hypothetical protein NGM37_44580, partial [Streptomyces sp. TRM76130]|nr:hypothetical protein [Streptomyces sp. TRM76130]
MTDAPRTEDGRTPPNDPMAERAVLGAMLLSRDAVMDICELLDGPEFYQPIHETLYRTILLMTARGQVADPITLADELRKAGELDRVGGPVYLHRLLDETPAAGMGAA